MTDQITCHSCTMPIESGTLCQYCSDDNGALLAFDEVFPRMVQWTLKNEAGIDRAAAERRTLEFMGSMPAWKDHATVRARLAR